MGERCLNYKFVLIGGAVIQRGAYLMGGGANLRGCLENTDLEKADHRPQT